VKSITFAELFCARHELAPEKCGEARLNKFSFQSR